MKTQLITFLISLFVTSFFKVTAQDIVLKICNHKKEVCKMNVKTKEVDALFKTSKSLIVRTDFSPNGNCICVMEEKNGVIKNGEYEIPPSNTLQVLDRQGNKILFIDEDIKEYVWSPDEEHLAYITGYYVEGGEPASFITTGIYVINIKTKSKETIAINITGGRAYDLRWIKTKDQNAIYFATFDHKRGHPVLKYDFSTKELTITKLKTIHISPDGKYYAMFPGETSEAGLCKSEYAFPHQRTEPCFHIYDTKTNKLVGQYAAIDVGIALDWVYTEGHYFLFTKLKYKSEDTSVLFHKDIAQSEAIIYDIETMHIIQKLDAEPVSPHMLTRWVAPPNSIVIEKMNENSQQEKSISIHKLPTEYKK